MESRRGGWYWKGKCLAITGDWDLGLEKGAEAATSPGAHMTPVGLYFEVTGQGRGSSRQELDMSRFSYHPTASI